VQRQIAAKATDLCGVQWNICAAPARPTSVHWRIKRFMTHRNRI
jgi:hypothetical protein